MTFTYEYPRPAVTVDAVIFRKTGGRWQALFIKRGKEPFIGMWALPGGFMEMEETLEEAIEREITEETGLTGITFRQLHTFSDVHRDPRHRTISTVFWGILENDMIIAKAGDDASDLAWFDVFDLPDLAFDHREVMKIALQMIS